MLEALDGEWWIDETGQATFADGDVGDLNHEAYVVLRLGGELLEALEQHPKLRSLASQLGFLSESIDLPMLRTTCCDWANLAESEGLLTSEEAMDVYEYICQELSWSREKFNQLIQPEADSRLWAIREWGWIRVAGRSVDLWDTNQSTLSRLCRGLEDAYDENLQDEHLFDLAVRSTGDAFFGVSFATLQTRDAGRLYRDRRRSLG